MPDNRDSAAERALPWILALTLGYAALRVIEPLGSALALAAAAALLLHPIYARLSARLHSENAAGGLVVAMACLLLVLPFALGVIYFVRESEHAYPLLRRWGQRVSGYETAPPDWLPEAARRFLGEIHVRSLLLDNIQDLGIWAGRAARAIARKSTATVFDMIVFILSLLVFLRDGAKAWRVVGDRLPLAARSRELVARRIQDIVIATVRGVFGVAVVQGLLSAAGFAILGVRFPVTLGALCMFFSPLPIVGPAIVWVPAALVVALDGHPGRALLLTTWFALAVGTSDNLLRPLLVGSRARLPVALVVAGAVGGVRAFGAVGVFLGPIVATLAVTAAELAFASRSRNPPDGRSAGGLRAGRGLRT